MPADISLIVIGHQSNFGLYVVLIAGLVGIVHGLTSKKFSRGGGYSGRDREYYVPSKGMRIFMVSISAAAVVISFWFLVRSL